MKYRWAHYIFTNGVYSKRTDEGLGDYAPLLSRNADFLHLDLYRGIAIPTSDQMNTAGNSFKHVS